MTDLTENSSIADLQNLPYWLPGEHLLNSEPAGESNMNLVLRIQTSHRNLIIKQSKPYVRKYPQIPAPVERIEVEYRFLQEIARDAGIKDRVPKVVFFDAESHILIMEDLGKGRDFSKIYSGEKTLTEAEIIQLVDFLSQMHELKVDEFPENMKMRLLNHEHLFQFPFLEENGFDLDTVQPGLQGLSLTYKGDVQLKEKLKLLGDRYLSPGKVLIHGDFYPESWLDVASGIKIIDPEFGYLGEPEFDLGIFLAHLDLAQQPERLKKSILSAYSKTLDLPLVGQFQGMEILRRLIGIAQLPLTLTLSQKAELLRKGKYLILN